MMPSASWFCSMAAATVRPIPEAVAAHDHRHAPAPSSSVKLQPSFSEYLVPSLKMWPTSMPRKSSQRAVAARAGIAAR